MNSNTNGVRYHSVKRSKEALEAYNQAIKSKPNHAMTYYNKGSLLYDLGRFEEALVALEKAADLGLTHPQLSNKISLAHWNLYWCEYQDHCNCG